MSDERPRIVLLIEGNYEVWRVQMIAVLMAAELWDVVRPSSEVTELPKGPKGVQALQRKRELARSKITLSLDPSQLPFVMKKEDPREMWEAIEKVHRSSSLNHALSLRRSFFRLCKRENETVLGWISRVTSRSLELSYTACPATDLDVILVVTEGLPPEFSPVVTQLDSLPDSSLTISDITTRIIGFEAQLLRSEAKASTTEDLSAHVARTDVVCHQCNGHGHYQRHDQQCFPNLRILDAKPGELRASLKIEPYHLNRVGTVHGGLIMSLTDTLGSLAVATKGHFMTGVSVDIGTSFVKPGGRAGDELIAKAVITGIGKSLAYTRVDFYNAQGQLAAYGLGFPPSPTTATALDHTKYVGKSAGHKDDVKFSEDGERVIDGTDID